MAARLHIDVLEARDLMALDDNGFSDPYVVLKLGERRERSSVVHMSLNPTWNEHFTFDYPAQPMELIITLWDEDIGDEDDFLGRVTIPLAPDTKFEKKRKWYPLQKKNLLGGAVKGDVSLRIWVEGGPNDSTRLPGFQDSSAALQTLPGSPAPTATANAGRTMAGQKLYLHITMHEARNLMAKDDNGFSDPFAVIHLGNIEQQTKIVYKSLFPVWEETFMLELPTPPPKDLEVTLWDDDPGEEPDFLGRVLLPLAKIPLVLMSASDSFQLDTHKTWYTLQKRSFKSTVRGDVCMRIYLSDSPTQLGESTAPKSIRLRGSMPSLVLPSAQAPTQIIEWKKGMIQAQVIGQLPQKERFLEVKEMRLSLAESSESIFSRQALLADLAYSQVIRERDLLEADATVSILRDSFYVFTPLYNFHFVVNTRAEADEWMEIIQRNINDATLVQAASLTRNSNPNMKSGWFLVKTTTQVGLASRVAASKTKYAMAFAKFASGGKSVPEEKKKRLEIGRHECDLLWCEMQHLTLELWSNMQHNKLVDTIDLARTTVSVSEDFQETLCFNLATANTAYIFRASSTKEVMTWVMAIKKQRPSGHNGDIEGKLRSKRLFGESDGWFVVKDGKLLRFPDLRSPTPTDTWDLCRTTVTKDTLREFSFILSQPGNRDMTLIAESEKQMQDWIDALHSAISFADKARPQCIIEGYLFKRTTKMMKEYKKYRWFALQQGKLCWYKKPNHVVSRGMLKTETLQLSYPEGYDTNLTIHLFSLASQRAYVLVAPTPQEHKAWIAALDEEIKRARKNLVGKGDGRDRTQSCPALYMKHEFKVLETARVVENTDDDDDDDGEEGENKKDETTRVTRRHTLEKLEPYTWPSATGRTVVLDLGSAWVRAGFAGDDCPYSCVFPSADYARDLLDHQAEGLTTPRPPLTEYFPGKTCFDGRNGVDWDAMADVIDATFSCHLGLSDPSRHATLMTEPMGMTRKGRTAALEIMFEALKVPGLNLRQSAHMCLAARGKQTGLVVNVGNSLQIVAVYDNYPLPQSIVERYFGGIQLSNFLGELLRREHGVAVGEDYSERAFRGDVQTIKHTLCYAAPDFDQLNRAALRGSPDHIRHFRLANGMTLPISDERYMVAEGVFRPSVLHTEVQPLHDLVLESIDRCEIDVRKSLLNNIVLGGGSTDFPGFPERLELELLRALAKRNNNSDVNIIAPHNRRYTAWIGASSYAASPAFNDSCIWLTDYNEYGASILDAHS
eukprot:TRINITY_DN1834_c0_g1_i1.p1 TRINITY_DN1834_c0_g1~~TRINITY_DN1834_c0_g1_i1.p1  ORF type:complete len:1243 (+),score=284.44 TRINITY_DN1834_c0_g1_i1:4-3732(+)